jgi:hypothetical protein
MARSGRRPGGRVWGPEQERLHPRDDRGRFAKKGGARWAARVVRGFEAGFGDTGAQQPGSTLRPGRTPGGLIDMKALRERSAVAAGGQRVKVGDYGQTSGLSGTHQVLVGAAWRNIIGAGYGGGRSYIVYRDAAGSGQEIDTPEVVVRKQPKLDAGAPLDAERHARMAGWEADARKLPPFKSLNQREAELRRRENEVAAAEVALGEATRKAKARARRKYPEKEGYGKYTRDEYVDRETWTEQHAVGMAKSSLEYLRGAEMGKYDTEIDVLTPPELQGNVDRSRPLAVYGDMLHAKAYDEASFRALAELESIPFELHQIVAAAMVRRREEDARWNRKPEGEPPGVYVGNGGAADLLPEYFKDTADNQPRGWHEGATYRDVAGVFSPTILAFAVGHTPNREGEKHTAAEHEFGHALDYAIGSNREQRGHDDRASHTAEWRALHDRVLANHGPGLSPYFQQEGDAGRHEFWAEAFAIWVRAYRKAITADMRDPDGYAASRTSLELKREFDITDPSALDDLHSYFLKVSAGAGVQWR